MMDACLLGESAQVMNKVWIFHNCARQLGLWRAVYSWGKKKHCCQWEKKGWTRSKCSHCWFHVCLGKLSWSIVLKFTVSLLSWAQYLEKCGGKRATQWSQSNATRCAFITVHSVCGMIWPDVKQVGVLSAGSCLFFNKSYFIHRYIWHCRTKIKLVPASLSSLLKWFLL